MADFDLTKLIVRVGANFQEFTDAFENSAESLDAPLQKLRDSFSELLQGYVDGVKAAGAQVIESTQQAADAVLEIDGKTVEVLTANRQAVADNDYQIGKAQVAAYADH